MIIKKCLECKKNFNVYPSRIKKGRGKYCSHNCQWNSEIWKENISKAHMGKKSHYEVWNKGKKGVQKHTTKTKKRISRTMKIKIEKGIIIPHNRGKTYEDEYGLVKSQEMKENKRKYAKEKWKNLDFKEKILKTMLKGLLKKPNKKEQFLDLIIQSNFSNQFVYNTKTILNGHAPDWVNINGEKKVILFNGIYWHLEKFQKKNPNYTKQDEENRLNKPYEEIGFKVIHIWEDELKNPQNIILKIKNFTRGEHVT